MNKDANTVHMKNVYACVYIRSGTEERAGERGDEGGGRDRGKCIESEGDERGEDEERGSKYRVIERA